MREVIVSHINGLLHVYSGGFSDVQVRLLLKSGSYYPSSQGKAVSTDSSAAWVLKLHPDSGTKLQHLSGNTWKEVEL